MVAGVWKKEAETGENAQRRREMEALIQDAKWNMYAELWDTAATQLERAKSLAMLACMHKG